MAPLEIRHRSVRPISAKHAQASRFLQQSRRYKEIPKKAYILAVGGDGNSQEPHFQRYHQAATQHPEWDAYTLSGGHNLMLDDPDGVAAILRRYSDDNDESISDDV
ncbi:hypothetical protein [Sphingopyxis sp. LC363]|uniref:hypothetical protein n=1 Tax=Sphingopyxis sp. LC363 TaxID=1120705 RepID=UPI001378B898|nr:hypothetical protein [Sphingopyxis sp. LC363]